MVTRAFTNSCLALPSPLLPPPRSGNWDSGIAASVRMGILPLRIDSKPRVALTQYYDVEKMNKTNKADIHHS